MPASKNPPRRVVLTILIGSCIICFTFISIFRNMSTGTRALNYQEGIDYAKNQHFQMAASDHARPDNFALGPAIAPKLGNETLKAELGRAAWKLFHTTFARFPDHPTQDEKMALQTYIHLFQRLYPCGECATHFGKILDEFPPQVSSRSVAAAWGCHVHNQVNKSLKKPIFDCTEIGDFYDCGCADDEESAGATGSTSKHSVREPAHDEMAPAALEMEEWQRGG